MANIVQVESIRKLQAPWVANGQIVLYTVQDVVYVSAVGLSTIAGVNVKSVLKHGLDYIIDKDTITVPGTRWGSKRLTNVIRLDTVHHILPVLMGWDNEKIVSALSQLVEDELQAELPARKRKFVFEELITRQIEQKLDELVDIAKSAAVEELKRLVVKRFAM